MVRPAARPNMARMAGRKKRRLLQQQQRRQAAEDPAAPLPNGQSSAEPPPPPPPAAEPPAEPPPEETRQLEEAVFCEPLQNLPDTPASLAALLRETAAAVSAGPSRLPDPRRALLLIRHCAPRLSPPQLSERLPVWSQFLAGLLRAPRQVWCREAVCRAAEALLAEEARLEEAHRLLAGGGLAQIVAGLVEGPEQGTPAVLRCLRLVLARFGRGCGGQRGQIERFLLRLFDAQQAGVSWAACRCVALLPHTGPAGAGGAAYAAAWAGQMRGLVRAAHAHLDRLLDGVVEVQTFATPEPGEHELELPDIPSPDPDPIHHRYRLSRRVSALCRVAALMLASAGRQPVTVPVTALLELTQRCVAAGAAPESAAMELQAARRALWDVRAAALRMLEVLILCCGVGLLERGTAISRLLLSSLQPGPSPTASPAAGAARCRALAALRAWLLVAGAGCGLEEQAERVVALLAGDVRPVERAAVTLQTNPASTNGVSSHASKKRKRRGAADWLESSPSSGPPLPPPDGGAGCRAALAALRQLVTALGPLLPAAGQRAAQQLCLQLLQRLQGAAGAPPPPYGRPACRAGLYRLLRALVADPHPAWPPPVQLAVGLFAQGAGDPDCTVSAICQDGQALCSRALQPTHPTLFFPVDLSAHSKPPSSSTASDPPHTAETPTDWSAAPAVPSDVTAVSDDVRGSAADIRSDVSECGSSASARLGSRLGSVTAAASAAASAAGDSRASTPPGASAAVSSQTSPDSEQTAPVPSAPANSQISPGCAQTPASSSGDQKPPPGWLAGKPTPAAPGAAVTTVTIASSESSASADDRRSVELAEVQDDQGSIVLGGSEDGEDAGQGGRQEEEDEVEILETKRPRRETLGDEDLAPDVADMLRDFVNEDPEVE